MPTVPPPPPPPPPSLPFRPADGGQAAAPAVMRPVDITPSDTPNVDPDKVATFLAGDFHALSEAAVVSWRISAAFSLLAPLAITSVLLSLALPGLAGLLLLGLAPLMFVVFVWWLPKARWKRWRWRLGPQALHLRFGVLIRRSEHVPYFRIQHIELLNGPVERWLGLTTLTVTTASASGAAVLPGLSQTDAPALRQALLDRAQAAVGEYGGDSRDAV